MKSCYQTLAFLFLLVGQQGVCCYSAEPDKIERFQSTPVRIEDRFSTDTRENYKIVGGVDWSDLELTMSPKASLALAKTLDSKFRYEIDLWPGDVEPGKQSVSQIHLYFSNSWQVVISIFRSVHEGRVYRQLIFTEVDGRDRTAKKPVVTELRRFPAFVLNGEIERWSLQYRYGLLQLRCNDHLMGTAYSNAFSSWLNGVVFTQPAQEIVMSRLLLSGKTIGYSPEQRELFVQINKVRQQAVSAMGQGNLLESVALEKSIIPLAEQCNGKNYFTIGLFHQSVAERLDILGLFSEASREHEHSAKLFRKTLGSIHPETLQSDMYLAEQLVKEGQLDQGVAAMKKSVLTYVKTVGTKSHNAHAMLTRLAHVLRMQAGQTLVNGLYLMSRKVREEIVSIYVNTHGADHWVTKNARLDLDFAKRVGAAEGKELAKIEEYILLEKEVNTRKSQSSFSHYLSRRSKLLSLVREIFGNRHPITADRLIADSTDHFNSGDIDVSITMLKEGIEIYRQLSGESDPRYINALGKLGSQLSMVQRYEEATELLEQACKLLAEQKFDRQLAYADMKLELGRHLIRMGQGDKAGKHLGEAHQLYRALGQHANPNALKTCERLADLWRAKGRLKEAEQYLDYHRNIVLATYGMDSAPYIDILNSEARHLYMRHKNDKAVQKYEEAAALVAKIYGKNSRAYEAVINGLIDVHIARDDAPAAVKYFEERLEFELHRREKLFNVYSEQEQFDRSMQDFFSLDALLILALDGHMDARRAYNHALAFKGAVTARQRSNRIAARTPEIRSQHEALAAIESQISARNQQELSPDAKQEYQQLLLERDQLETLLLKKNRDYRIASQRTRVADLQRVLPSKTVFVDYFEYLKPKGFLDKLFSSRAKIGMIAFVVAKDGEVQLVDLGSVKPIAEAWSAWRGAMDAEPYYELVSKEKTLAELTDQHGAELRRLIWDPLAKHFGDADTIVVSPSMHLVACPFAALPAPDGDSFLIEQYAFATLATPRLLPELLSERDSLQSTKLLLVGDIDFDASTGVSREFFKKLPAAELELSPIRYAFIDRYKNATLKQLRGKQATEAQVREQILGAQFIHFHTHGFCFQENELLKFQGKESTNATEMSSPLISGIALAGGNRGLLAKTSTHEDGILWSDEINKLDLHAAELVTLSACQTAIGNLVPGEGMLGAQRALHVAGARSSLTALWAVDDRSTRTLMSNFYKQLWDQELSKAKALQQAMIFMLREFHGNEKPVDNDPSRHRTPPSLWAGFVLHGDWR